MRVMMKIWNWRSLTNSAAFIFIFFLSLLLSFVIVIVVENHAEP